MNPVIPTHGRIVLFVLPESSPRQGEERAAIVTSNFGGLDANLTVFYDQVDDVNADKAFYPLSHLFSVPYDESGKPGTWHWPQLVKYSTCDAGAPAVTATNPDVVPVASTTDASPDAVATTTPTVDSAPETPAQPQIDAASGMPIVDAETLQEANNLDPSTIQERNMRDSASKAA